MSQKIFSIKDIQEQEIDVLTYGHFNTIHPGHIRYLEYAKAKGTNLSVALIGDGKDKLQRKFQFSQDERARSLILLPLIDKVILLEDEELDKLIEFVNPNFLILGKN